MTDEPKTLKQCKSCPWRVDCVPDRDIPNYKRGLHEGLTNTIAEPGDVSALFKTEQHIMACRYAKPGAEFPCAGWLHHQIGEGNNLAVRLRVMNGSLPVPEVDGPQHATFEETLCCDGVTKPTSSTELTRRPVRDTTSGRTAGARRGKWKTGNSSSAKRRRASRASR